MLSERIGKREIRLFFSAFRSCRFPNIHRDRGYQWFVVAAVVILFVNTFKAITIH